MNDVLLFVVVGAALAFDFTNGFHDTANAMATTIATKALPPKQALGLAATLNFVGAFLSISVAATIAGGIVDQQQIALPIIFAGLLGAIGFNLATWYLGLPSSSSHALIGGMVGAMLANGNLSADDFTVPLWVKVGCATAFAAGTFRATSPRRRASPPRLPAPR